MLEVTRRILAHNGYVVLTAGNGPEALELVEQHPGAIDVLLTDVVMPEMLGREVAARVAALRPGIRITFMSGYAQAVLDDLPLAEVILDKWPRCSRACGRCSLVPHLLDDLMRHRVLLGARAG